MLGCRAMHVSSTEALRSLCLCFNVAARFHVRHIIFDISNLGYYFYFVKDCDFKILVRTAFTPEELDFLLKDAEFREIYNSGDACPQTFELLCCLGQYLLDSAGFYRDRRNSSQSSSLSY